MTKRTPHEFKLHHYNQYCRYSSSAASSWPTLESATGRARKRRRRQQQQQQQQQTGATLNNTSMDSEKVYNHNNKKDNDDDTDDEEWAPSYPKGRPWRVLWPQHLSDPSSSTTATMAQTPPKRKWPRWSDIENGWARYLETWEDGLRGEPSPEKLKQRQAAAALAATEASTNTTDTTNNNNNNDDVISKNTLKRLDKVQSNVTKNVHEARETAQDLLQQAKDQTGIHSQDDLRRIASETMQLMTECLKEFMAGYRQGRDEEVDKMLHEYFQENDNHDNQDNTPSPSSSQKTIRRRKPKRMTRRSL